MARMGMRRTVVMALRRACLTAAAGLAVVACGGAASSDPGPLRGSFSGQRARVDGIVSELGATLTRAGPQPDALLSNEFSALGARAEQEAAVIAGLGHPPGYNTRLRDLDHALGAVASGLDQLSTAATEHQPAATRADISALRGDAAAVRATAASLARMLGLRAS
jgi:hypothetical protein